MLQILTLAGEHIDKSIAGYVFVVCLQLYNVYTITPSTRLHVIVLQAKQACICIVWMMPSIVVLYFVNFVAGVCCQC